MVFKIKMCFRSGLNVNWEIYGYFLNVKNCNVIIFKIIYGGILNFRCRYNNWWNNEIIFV